MRSLASSLGSKGSRTLTVVASAWINVVGTRILQEQPMIPSSKLYRGKAENRGVASAS
jgi:hypothetical protein